MKNTFDKLYNEFMKPYGVQKISTSLIQRVMDNIPFLEPNSREAVDYLFQILGEPNQVFYFEEDGLYYEQNVWKAEYGHIICNIPYDSPPEGMYNLEEELKIALANEDYERAVEIRDLMKKKE